MLPFEYFRLNDLPDVLGYFFMAWLILGVPIAVLSLPGGYVLSRFNVLRFRTRAHVHFLPLLFTFILLGLLFGVAAGYFEAWTYERDSSALHQDDWVDYLAIPGIPGDAMANSYGGDWQDDEAWDYRTDIAILDGFFWASVAGMAMVSMSLGSRWLLRQQRLASRPAPVAESLAPSL